MLCCGERRLRRAPDDLGLPEVELAFFDLVAVVDHSEERLWLIFTPFKERFLKEFAGVSTARH